MAAERIISVSADKILLNYCIENTAFLVSMVFVLHNIARKMKTIRTAIYDSTNCIRGSMYACASVNKCVFE